MEIFWIITYGLTVNIAKQQATKNKVFYKTHTKTERKANWLGNLVSSALSLARVKFFRRFRIREFAFVWRAKQGVRASSSKFTWAKRRALAVEGSTARVWLQLFLAQGAHNARMVGRWRRWTWCFNSKTSERISINLFFLSVCSINNLVWFIFVGDSPI
jgi:hypothetical protein